MRALYPSLVLWEPDLEVDYSTYNWFKREDGRVFGIQRTQLSDYDETVLNAIFTRVQVTKRARTKREVLWEQALFGEEAGEMLDIDTFRLIFFEIDCRTGDLSLIEEGLKAIFFEPMPLLWLSHDTGVIVEEFHEKENEMVDLDEVIETIMSDLYVNLHFFVGERMTDVKSVKYQFQWMKKVACFSFQRLAKDVMYVKDILPYLLVNHLDKDEREYVSAILLKEVREEKELLQTIQTYLESNSNVTEAAKKMYMHRNSLQYRIDKFIEITNIDIRTFEGAVTTYLALKMLDV